MIESAEVVWSFSIISLILYSIQVLRIIIFMSLGYKSPSSSSSLLWKNFRSRVSVHPKGITLAFKDQTTDNNNSCYCRKIQVNGSLSDNSSSSVLFSTEGSNSSTEEIVNKNICLMKRKEFSCLEKEMNLGFNDYNEKYPELINNFGNILMQDRLNSDVELSSDLMVMKREKMMNSNKKVMKAKKKPARLVIPENCLSLGFSEMCEEEFQKEFEVEGRDFCLASRKGKREIMEDGYGIINDIMGDPKQVIKLILI